MRFGAWIVITALFLVVFLIMFGFGWWYRNRAPPPAPPDRYSAPFVWSNPVPGPDPSKNSCQLYQFPTGSVTIGGVPTVIPGTPSFDPHILNTLPGVVTFPACLDTDQIVAQQLQHQCIAPIQVEDGNITRCFLINGGTTGLGGSEIFYSNSNCLKTIPCSGQLSLVSVNFQSPTVPQFSCLQSPITGDTVTMANCDPTQPNQLFRITRVNPDQNPNALQPGQGQNGLIAQILDRTSGLCVLPDTTPQFTTFSPSYLTPVNPICQGPDIPIPGLRIKMGACTGGFSPGYVWALLPSIPYCPVVGGCTGGQITITPPQIADISRININDIPSGPSGYQGLTGPSAVYKWFHDQGVNSMYYGGTGDQIILRTMSLNVAPCVEKPYTAQYINLASFNTISRERVCRADLTVSCTPL